MYIVSPKNVISYAAFFLFAQAIFKNEENIKLLKKMNNQEYEILKNLEILCFIDEKNIDIYFEFLKSQS